MNVSWVLVRDMDLQQLVADLGMVFTGRTLREVDDLACSYFPFAGVTLKSGWSGVFCMYALALDLIEGTDPPRIAQISKKHKAVVCVELAHALSSYASLWLGGRPIWSIKHLCSRGLEDLQLCGNPPSSVGEFVDRAKNKQRKGGRADYMFNVPVDVAQFETDFRYDTCGDADFVSMQELAPADGNVVTKKANPPKWWQGLGSICYDGTPIKPVPLPD